ncbi:phage tail assembly protein [Pantoea ananatis]|uniref:phage tail assembly protein n=1 Tax=Pantoea ananas TaxID=553 RepID=UPI0004956D82|nr:phage tail assembly protein [Pantoea ananatis]
MAELERSTVISLSVPLSSDALKQTWESLPLRAPVLAQVEQFYEAQAKRGSLSAMRLLLSLTSGVPESVLSGMDFLDYRKCEEYLLGFLSWKPSGDGSV